MTAINTIRRGGKRVTVSAPVQPAAPSNLPEVQMTHSYYQCCRCGYVCTESQVDRVCVARAVLNPPDAARPAEYTMDCPECGGTDEMCEIDAEHVERCECCDRLMSRDDSVAWRCEKCKDKRPISEIMAEALAPIKQLVDKAQPPSIDRIVSKPIAEVTAADMQVITNARLGRVVRIESWHFGTGTMRLEASGSTILGAEPGCRCFFDKEPTSLANIYKQMLDAEAERDAARTGTDAARKAE